jgi:hypothetical protein
MLLVMAKAKRVPPKLDRHRVTAAQAADGLAKSAAAIAGVLNEALSAGGRVPGIHRDAAGFLTSAVVHEAHCRGQICLRARELGLSPRRRRSRCGSGTSGVEPPCEDRYVPKESRGGSPSGWKISSISASKTFAILKASGRLGS